MILTGNLSQLATDPGGGVRGLVLAALAAVLVTAAPVSAQILDFEALEGWQADDHRAALTAFRTTCDLLDAPEWRPLCALAADAGTTDATARQFFELFFRPVVVGAPPALFTGYYEPELPGSLTRTPRYAYPLYAKPPEMTEGQPFHTREVIESGILRGRGLELVWLDDPVEVYFLQVQGSGRIRLPDGRVLRLGYGGKNSQPYRSVGKTLLDLGVPITDVSAQDIKAWVRANPSAGRQLLNTNPSYVFFRKLPDLAADRGPIGAMGRSITTMRSVAIDPKFTPLGAPVWVEKNGSTSIRSLMIAQDTGGAIKGAQRADIFYGTGYDAGETAGRIKDGGRMVLLLPIDRAYAMLPDG